MTNRVLFDANIWYSRTLTDWVSLLCHHEGSQLFDVCWTEDVLAEARYHLRKNNPESASEAIDWRFDYIRQEFEFGRIVKYEIKDKSHPDPGDWHVVNAAMQGNVDYLVTDDKKFGRLTDDIELTFETHTVDSFLILLDDSAPSVVRSVADGQLTYWRQKNRPFNLVKALEKAGAPTFAERVRNHLQWLQDRSPMQSFDPETREQLEEFL